MNSNFRRLAITVLAAFAAPFATFAASPAATQNWVKDYVSEHATTGTVSSVSSKVAPVSASISVDGTNYTYSFTMYFADEPTWKIAESTVTGMVAGTHFALDAYGNACNYTNAACDTIYQSVSTNWAFVTKSWTTNGTPVFVTNRRDVVQLDFEVNGVAFRGYEDYRHREVMAAGVSNHTGIIRFRRSYVTPSVKAKLLTPPAQTSWWSLFLGTANAAWVLGDWDTGTATEGGTLYTAHYSWDGESLTVDIPSVSIEGSAGEVRFQTGTSYEIKAGGDTYCKKTSITASDVTGEVMAQLLLDALDVMGTIEYLNFQRLVLNGKFDSQITAAIESALQPYNVSLTCPQEKFVPDPEEEEEEEEVPDTPTDPEDPPTRPENLPCLHSTVRCGSSLNRCVFRCAVCQAVVKEYSGHHFADSSHHCAVCDNSYADSRGNSLVCGIASGNKNDHCFSEDGETFGGDETGCRCKHGTIWARHGNTTYVTGQWETSADMHWKLKECGICGYDQIKSDEGKHTLSKSQPIYVDNSTCVISNICSTCGYSVYVETCGHVPFGNSICTWVNDSLHSNSYFCAKCCEFYGGSASSHVPDGKYESYVNTGDDGHKLEKYCTGCKEFYRSEILPHTPASKIDYYETCGDAVTHYEVRTCSAKGCGQVVKGDPVACSTLAYGPLQITLVHDATDCDFYPCQYCPSGRGREVPHNWYRCPDYHECVQDEENKHLKGEHTFEDGVCTVCGYVYSSGKGTNLDLYEESSDWVDVQCKSDCCSSGKIVSSRIYSTNGVVIAEEDRGPWIKGECDPSGQTCRYLSGGECCCPYCKGEDNLLYGDCYCSHIAKGDCIKFTDSILSGNYVGRYTGSTCQLVDFTDPVYDIQAAFDDAFVGCPNLMSVNLSTVTNISELAFVRAFQSCPSLTHVFCSGLVTAGNEAFEDAFAGCTSLREVDFGSLVSCGYDCFRGAFTGTSLAELSFPELVYAGVDLDFFAGGTNTTLTALSVPKLDASEARIGFEDYPTFRFDTMPALRTLDLSRVSTNAYDYIGDMSFLRSLARLDLHAMSAVPPYSRGTDIHAPINSTNLFYMIVVPNDLYAEWIAAPGWSGIADHIAPYSNQVVRPLVPVAFVPDNGGTVPSTNILYGETFTAPTNVKKYDASVGGLDDGAFAFAGWYTDASLTVPFTNGVTVITNDTTLYAKWTDNRTAALTCRPEIRRSFEITSETRLNLAKLSDRRRIFL